MATDAHGKAMGSPAHATSAWKMPTINYLEGQYVILKRASADMEEDLYKNIFGAHLKHLKAFTYVFIDYSETPEAFHKFYDQSILGDSTARYYAIYNKDHGGALEGLIALKSPSSAHGKVELGGLTLAPPLRATRAATETYYLLLHHVFDVLHYRRCSWMRDVLNTASVRLASRLGFSYEGAFRNDYYAKGRNYDTARFSITDTDWPPIRAAFQEYLRPDNFDENGRHKKPLKRLTAPLEIERRAAKL